MGKINLRAALVLAFCCTTTLACHGTLLARGITAEDKRQILHEHNKLRQVVATGRYPGQPGAENMREIVWDEELAVRAQQWADNCEFRHDPQRTINRFTMGQNLAIIWSTAPLAADDGDFPSRIQSWFNEVQKYSFGDAWSPKTGHYSQLVWGETSLVGCGYSEYKDSYKYNKLWVCNYGPGGNVVGYNPYEAGKPNCGTYGMRPSSHYQGLCAAPTSPAVGIQTNTIETYEYTQTKHFNNKPTSNYYYHTTTTKYPQHATAIKSSYTSPSTSSNPIPQQATLLSAGAGSNHWQQHKYQTHRLSTATASQTSTSEQAARHSGGYSFGTSTNGGSTAYTSEASQYKYKNKLEAYKPSAAEFQNAVRKHTILRTSSSSESASATATAAEAQPSEQEVQDAGQQQPEYEIIIEPQYEEASTTAKPAKHGWSLLTWRG